MSALKLVDLALIPVGNTGAGEHEHMPDDHTAAT